MPQKPVTADQELLGYRLKERIGAGGYGEVWSAEAPGGLMKAVKVVFGYHDEQRAQNELRSLDRVKSLRHPFLLNLERIEVVDGQLVIITELADMSMADEFNEFVAKGETGIPREMLLNQLLEAADALDYIYGKHSLQHLDIKPENLLLVGRHIKVADFGLVKDLQDISQSLMGGLTPAYAAPELFDGRPSGTSDQYSLAIVFQEMLTGQRPFPGTTPAALAAQHMNGRPNLRPLAKSDQVVIAKALSKDPNVRFSNCVTMVQELMNRQNVKKSIRRSVTSRKRQDTESKDIKIRNGLLPTDVTDVLNRSVFQDIPAAFEESPDTSEAKSKFTPTFVIGVGKTGSEIVDRLSGKIEERFGHAKLVPSCCLLKVDTDRNAMGGLSLGDSMGCSHSLLLPLRKPDKYRDRQKRYMSWLSRRWIYNVPRSLKTEGIRPLGRLAFVDNFDELYDTIQAKVEMVVDHENFESSLENTGMVGEERAAQVFFVGSISGGTGSGMLNDLAYTVKLIFAENGVTNIKLHGLLLHSTSFSGDPGLASTNSLAFLTELAHFTQFGFPGDASCGLPEVPDEPPFEHCYFIDLGDDLQQEEMESRFDELSEYIYLNTFSEAKKFFRTCRKFEEEFEYFSLRSIGIAMSGLNRLDCFATLVKHLCHNVITKWTEGEADSEDSVASLVSRFEFSEIEHSLILDFLLKETEGLENNEQVLELNKSLESMLDGELSTMQIRELYNGFFGDLDTYRGLELHVPQICQSLESWVRSYSSQYGGQICNLIASLVEGERLDLNAAISATTIFGDRILENRESISADYKDARNEIEDLESEIVAWTLRDSEEKAELDIKESINKLMAARIKEIRRRYCDQFFQMLYQNVSQSSEHYNQMIQHLKGSVGIRFADAMEEFPEQEEGWKFDHVFVRQIIEQLSELVPKIELRMYYELIQRSGGYLQAIGDQNCLSYLIPETMQNIAAFELSTAIKSLDLDKAIEVSGATQLEIDEWAQQVGQRAETMLDECGGKIRQLIAVPAKSNSPKTAERFFNPSQPRKEVVAATNSDLIIVNETEDVQLANVAFRLLQSRPDAIDLTKRLHTRSDIEWITLDEFL